MRHRPRLTTPLWCCLFLLLAGGCATTGSPGSTTAPPAQATAESTADHAGVAAAVAPAGTNASAIAAPGEIALAGDAVATPPGAITAGEPVAVDLRTQAEKDFDAIYGVPQDYDPVFDATLPTPAELPTSYDPWETLNRRVHAFNNVVDRVIAKPLAKAYVAVVPRPVRLGVGNFFNNLGQPVSALNALLQGKPKQAGQALGRFAVNATLGLGGVIDVASKFNIPNRSEDFGQTLGVWGWERSRYLELPLFGPRTVRDAFGLVGDAPLAPLRQVNDSQTRIFLQGLQLVDVRTQLMAVDSMREGATDEYALFRDAWLQRRNYQISGDREQEESLPEYLRDDPANPTVPVDAMPVPVPGGT